MSARHGPRIPLTRSDIEECKRKLMLDGIAPCKRRDAASEIAKHACDICDEVRKEIRGRRTGAGIDVRVFARHFGIGRLPPSCRFTFPTREPTFAKREDGIDGRRHVDRLDAMRQRASPSRPLSRGDVERSKSTERKRHDDQQQHASTVIIARPPAQRHAARACPAPTKRIDDRPAPLRRRIARRAEQCAGLSGAHRHRCTGAGGPAFDDIATGRDGAAPSPALPAPLPVRRKSLPPRASSSSGAAIGREGGGSRSLPGSGKLSAQRAALGDETVPVLDLSGAGSRAKNCPYTTNRSHTRLHRSTTVRRPFNIRSWWKRKLPASNRPRCVRAARCRTRRTPRG